MDDRSILLSLFNAALEAAMPAPEQFAPHLPDAPRGRTIVVGAGKAAGSMAAAFETAWARPCEGLVVTRYRHSAPTHSIEVVEAGHPIPDGNGVTAATRILHLAESAGPDDLVVALISGGASSLLALPALGITLEQKRSFTQQLLASGAPIDDINAFRMALSAIKGGRLAKAASPARVVTYVVSDVPGDDPALVGSGPTIASRRATETVLAIAQRYGLRIDEDLEAAIRRNEMHDGGDQGSVHVLTSARRALEATAVHARSLGIAPLVLGDRIEGEAREVAKVLAGIAMSCRAMSAPAAPPCVLLSGGETTVTVRGNGRGGRNAEFLLSLFQVLRNGSYAAISVDTDGIDGTETNAGAWFDGSTAAKAASLEVSARDYLNQNDAYSFFQKLELLIETGPTLTNVNDFRAILLR